MTDLKKAELDKDLLIKKLRIQVSSMRNLVVYMDKKLTIIRRRPIPALPSFVFESL